jgi:hypothetical protein
MITRRITKGFHAMTQRQWLLCALLMGVLIVAAGCNLGSAASNFVPTSQNSAGDGASAQQFLPTLAGYTATNADNIVDALSSVAGAGSLATGNLPGAALITQINGMIQCYQNIGAVAARVYTPSDAAVILNAAQQGQIPTAGVVAVVNRTRLLDTGNLISCALGGGLQAFSAQADQPQPCAGSGSFTAPNGDTMDFVYAATNQTLCAQFQSTFPQGTVR